MVNLIKNELIKVTHKKSFYIFLLVMLGFTILTNVIYKNVGNGDRNWFFTDATVNEYENELKTLDPTKESDISNYIDSKANLEAAKLGMKYSYNSWQAEIILQKMTDLYNKKFYYTYDEKDATLLKEVDNKIATYIERFDTDNWQAFTNEEIASLENQIKTQEKEKANTIDTVRISELDYQLKFNNKLLELEKIRLDKNVGYADSYMNRAIQDIQRYYPEVLQYESKDSHEREDEYSYQYTKNNIEKDSYILETGKDLNNNKSVRNVLLSVFEDQYIIIIAFVVMISGSIVSDEFSKGTVKLLLVRPYSRFKILLSKFITSLIMVVFSIIVIVLLQLLVGGVLFGFSSLSIPAVVYSFSSNSLKVYNVFTYVGILALSMLPQIILLMTLSFALSSLFNNTALAVALSILGSFAADIINNIVIIYNVKFMRYFVTLNWNFGDYLFGKVQQYQYVSLGFSIAVCIIYFVIMIVPSFIVFKKRNIKNV